MIRMLAVCAVLLLGGCARLRKPKPVPPKVVVLPPQTPEVKEHAPMPPPPPVATTSPPATKLPPEVVQAPQPEPPKVTPPPKPAPRTRRQPAPVAANPTPQPPPAAGTPPAPPPQLTAIVSPEEQQRLNTAIDQSVKNAETDLARVGDRRLRGQQGANLRRAKSFLRQAQETRGDDLATALALAQRAETLARDLAASLR
ncbi:MAG: hypothetical protein FJW39_23730 [Acidobacteria bacterium]|nr:hypothetical protein [Acidobacteriota bacterium]